MANDEESAYVEVWANGGVEIVTLTGERIMVGRDPSNRVALTDPAISSLHASLERYGSAWVIRDLGSSNGTFVNGERVAGDIPLRNGDEVSMGASRLVFRSRQTRDAANTERLAPPPSLTRREQELLVALCRPLMSGEAFSEPATVRQLAKELFVGEPAIKFHLGNLYNKFDIFGSSGKRRTTLANEALRRGAVKRADLRPPTDKRT